MYILGYIVNHRYISHQKPFSQDIPNRPLYKFLYVQVGSRDRHVKSITQRRKHLEKQTMCILTTSPSMFRNMTETYKQTPPPPPRPTPSPPYSPKRGRVLPLPPFGEEGEGVGWGGGGGVCLYVCVMFRNIDREVVSTTAFFLFFQIRS